jgi:hypothetical protein
MFRPSRPSPPLGRAGRAAALVAAAWLVAGAAHAAPPVVAASAKPAAEDEAPNARDWIISATLAQREAFGANLEVWSNHVRRVGYWRNARLGGGVGFQSYDELNDDGLYKRVSNVDYALGFAMDSMRVEPLRLRSLFLAGQAEADHHPSTTKAPEGRDRARYAFVEMRHGFDVVLPTHEVSATEPDDASLFEIGVGLRWNFIDAERDLKAGDTRIRPLTLFPYISANSFL